MSILFVMSFWDTDPRTPGIMSGTTVSRRGVNFISAGSYRVLPLGHLLVPVAIWAVGTDRAKVEARRGSIRPARD